MAPLVSTWMGDCSKCCLKGAANPQSRLDLISRPILVVTFVGTVRGQGIIRVVFVLVVVIFF